jgi:hypothetical protein
VLQGLPFKQLTHKSRLTTTSLPSAFSTPTAAGPSPVISCLRLLADPLRARCLSSFPNRDGAFRFPLLHCQTPSSHPNEGTPGPITTRQWPSVPAIFCSFGLHYWPLSPRARVVFISIRPANLRALPTIQFGTSVAHHPTPPRPRASSIRLFHSTQRAALFLTNTSPVAHIRPTSTSPLPTLAPPLHNPSKLCKSGQLRDASSLALGVSGSRTSLQSAAQEPPGWDGQ